MINIGEAVQIKPDLHEGHDYEWYVDPDMVRYRGLMARITGTIYDTEPCEEDNVYHIDLDDGEWGWTPDMFERCDDFYYELEEIDFLFS